MTNTSIRSLDVRSQEICRQSSRQWSSCSSNRLQLPTAAHPQHLVYLARLSWDISFASLTRGYSDIPTTASSVEFKQQYEHGCPPVPASTTRRREPDAKFVVEGLPAASTVSSATASSTVGSGETEYHFTRDGTDGNTTSAGAASVTVVAE